MSGSGLVGEPPKVGTGNETNLQFCRLPVPHNSRSGPTHTRQVVVPTGQGPPPMIPIQWHLKNNWHIPESLEKLIPIPRSIHHHLRWWLEQDHVLLGQPLHPLQHALQIFTGTSNEGWGAHLGNHTAQGVWSVREKIAYT